MPLSYVAERAISPSGELVWVVVDREGFRLHEQASMFLAGLRARDLSVNTERVYAGRVALYLSYCASRGLEWADPGFLGLKGFQDWLVSEPLPARSSRMAGAGPRFRSRGTANAVMTSVCEFLRFGVTQGWVLARVAGVLSEPKFLRCLPVGYDPGEDDQYRQVMRPVFRFAGTERGYEALSGEQLERILGLAWGPGRIRPGLNANGIRSGQVGLRWMTRWIVERPTLYSSARSARDTSPSA